jgi:hypothetical protein
MRPLMRGMKLLQLFGQLKEVASAAEFFGSETT